MAKALAPSISNSKQTQADWLPDPSRLERMLGPEWARIVRGLITNPLSVLGLLVVVIFVTIAALAPVLAPPVRANADPYLIPRDGFSPSPKPPGV